MILNELPAFISNHTKVLCYIGHISLGTELFTYFDSDQLQFGIISLNKK